MVRGPFRECLSWSAAHGDYREVKSGHTFQRQTGILRTVRGAASTSLEPLGVGAGPSIPSEQFRNLPRAPVRAGSRRTATSPAADRRSERKSAKRSDTLLMLVGLMTLTAEFRHRPSALRLDPSSEDYLGSGPGRSHARHT